MLRITVLKVGSIRENFFKEGVAEYSRRIRPYARFDLKSVRDFPLRGQETVEKEGDLLLREIQRLPHDFLVALDERGKAFSSRQLARFLSDRAIAGQSHLCFVVGGTLGLSQGVLESADLRLSLSPLTFPHQMVPLILAEQLFRAFKIQRGEPYHH